VTKESLLLLDKQAMDGNDVVSGGITIKWVRHSSEIPAKFFDLCFPPPLEGRFWYETLEDCGLEDQFEFAYALIFRNSEPVGIAPTFVMNVPMDLVAPPAITKLLKMAPLLGKLLPFLVYQRTLFVGSPCSDEGTVGLIAGVRLSEVAPVLHEAVMARAKALKADMITWKDFCELDAQVLVPFAKSCGMFKVPSYPGTRLNIPPDGMEGYFRGLKASRRHKLKKKIRRSKERMDLTVEVMQEPSPEALDEIFDLFQQTYEKGETKFERLNRRFFELIARSTNAYFVILRRCETERIVAFMLCFHFGSRVVNKFIGLDYQLAEKAHLYFRLWEAALEWAVSSGASEFQSGQTGYSAKIDIGHELVPLTNFCQHRQPVIHKVYELVARTISWSTLDEGLATHLKAHPEDDLSEALAADS